MRPGQTALLIGASGGIGTALLQRDRLAGLKLYGLASPSKHAALADYGATPVDYRTEDFVSVIRQIEPGGLDAVFDGMGGGYLPRGFGLLKRGDVCSRGEATSHSSVRIDLRKKRSPVI